MKKLSQFLDRIPRSVRAISNILLILLLLYLCWCSSGKPLYNDMLEYRRMEKTRLLGPGTIVHELFPCYGKEEYPVDHYGEFSHTIVSETHEGIIFCGIFNQKNNREPIMTYQKKTGDISLAVPPTDMWDWGGNQWDLYLPIYVFHEHPDAARAELDLTIEGVWDLNYSNNYIQEHHKEPYIRSYNLKSRHKTEDFFLFSIFVENIFEHAMSIEPLIPNHPEKVWETMHGPDGDAPQLLSSMCNNALFYNNETGTIVADIRLYDENNNLVAEKTITIQAPTEKSEEYQEVQNDEN